MKKVLLASVAVVSLSFMAITAHAGAIWLNTTADDQWNTIGNWTADPANNTCILRGDSPPGNIYLNADHQIARLRHNNANVWFLYIAPTNLNNATLTITGAAETFDNAAAGSTLTFDGTPNANGARPILQITGGAGSPWTQGANAGSLLQMNWEVTGGGTLHKTGAGTVVLGAANTYWGATTVSEGTLRVDGSIAATTNAFTVETGGILGGTGTIGSPVTVTDGGIAPGASAGTLTFNSDLILGSTSFLNFELDGTDQTVGGGVNDLAVVLGNLTLDGTLNVADLILDGFQSASVNDTWRLINYTGTLTDNGLDLGSLPPNLSYSIDTSTANQVDLIVTAVPEPSTIVLGLLGGLGLLVIFQRRRSA